MKKIFFLLISQIIFSQIEKNIGDFQELKALDGINVILEKSSENNIKITGDNTENVVVINKSGTLILRMQLVKKLKGQNTVVKLKHKSKDIHPTFGSCSEFLVFLEAYLVTLLKIRKVF